MGHCVRGQCGFSTPSQWVVRWFRTKAERYRYVEHSFPESQPFSGTIVCTTDSTFLSYFQTCKKGVLFWDPVLHPWSRPLADPSFDPLKVPRCQYAVPSGSVPKERGIDISSTLSHIPNDSQTLSSVPQTHTILSYFKTCKKGGEKWDCGRHPWSRPLADPSFLTCSLESADSICWYPTTHPWSPPAPSLLVVTSPRLVMPPFIT